MLTLILTLTVIAAPPDTFDRAARVLSEHCVRCHNPEKTRGGLDLSTRESLITGGATHDGIVPGDPKQSHLLQRAADGSMPPEKDGRRLSSDEVKAIEEWIKASAPWRKGVTLPLQKQSTTATTLAPSKPAAPCYVRTRRILFRQR